MLILQFTLSLIKINYGIFKVSTSKGLCILLEITNANSDNAIGEIYYNKDAGSKYLSQTTDQNSEYLKNVNRIQKY